MTSIQAPSTAPGAFGALRQLGYIVEDLSASVQAWTTELGVGPWTIIRNIELHATFDGQPSKPLIDIALSYRGDVQIELIQQKNDSPSPYRAWIKKGHYGLHHTAFLCEHIDDDLKLAETRGLRVVCDIRQPDGGGRYVYLQSAALGGNQYIEFLEATQQMKGMFAQGVPAAAAWDGSGQPYVIDFALIAAAKTEMSVDCSPIADREVTNWSETADVVIVGLGAAGACAAIEARAAGAEVLVLERASGGGGTTALAAGHLYFGGGTPVQQAVGVEDSVEAMFAYLMANTPVPEEDKIRAYCEQSVAQFNWLEQQGVPFNRTYYRGKHVVQPTDECLIESGNEKVWPYREKAKPASRGHKVARTGEAGGSLLMEKLIGKVMASGARVVCDAGVRNLIVDKSGRVVGVRYRRFDEIVNVRANKGVVLAAGGFAMNEEMLKQYCPALADPRVYKLGNPNDDGGAIRMGLAAGAQALHMDGFLVTSPIYPEEKLIKGILVNAEGKRFVAEDSYHARSTAFMMQQPEQRVYLIVDQECHGRPEMMGQQLIDAWETVAEMEAALQLPAGALQRTVDEYNRHAARSEDPAFHKGEKWLQPLNHPPYGAFECSLGKAGYVGFTLGGLRTSIDGEVLNAKEQPVAGLYAAGACASNIAQDGTGYSSGTCIGESTFFGRRAGRAAAQASVKT